MVYVMRGWAILLSPPRNLLYGVLMICEMCGKDVPFTKRVTIESSVLSVCSGCMRFGKAVTPGQLAQSNSPEYIGTALERRQIRQRTKDVYEQFGDRVLADDYNVKISRARNKMGMNQEELARKINEKKSIINKLETKDMRPDDRLLKKLESTLKITLTETATEAAVGNNRKRQSGGLTLADMIKSK